MQELRDKSNENLVKMASLGIEAEAFIRSDLFFAINDIAKERSREAMMKMIDVDPEDSKEIRKLQNEIRIAEMFENFILDIINNGRVSAMSLEEGSGYSGDDDFYDQLEDYNDGE